MISAEARPYIDASVPVLREHGLTITRTFYRNMFAAHPELINLFNMGNQESGVQQQSLAAAVFAYAANIDNAAALTPVVSRIVHKHASVGIKAEHYPIVGRHLLGAIQEVLGDAASPALLAAWDEAYGSLASALIDAEKNLYAQAGTAPGQLYEMRVLDVRTESEDIKSYRLAPLDGDQMPDFKPGQYVSVAVTFPDGLVQLRQYSLSDAPDGKTLRISVKRERKNAEQPAGQVSNWLHNHIRIGDSLRISRPFGDFTPDTASGQPVVLLSAGVGITPMISVLKQIAQTQAQRQVLFAHANKDEGYHAHRGEVASLRQAMPNLRIVSFYEEANESSVSAEEEKLHRGRMDVAKLPAWPLQEASVYLCGPTGFMQEQWRALIGLGVPAQLMHREVFGPELLDYLG